MRDLQRASGAIATAAPLLLVVGGRLYDDWWEAASSRKLVQLLPAWAMILAAGAVFVGGVDAARSPGRGRRLIFVGLVIWLGQALVVGAGEPLWILGSVVALALAAHRLWPVSPSKAVEGEERRHDRDGHARGAAQVALGGATAALLAGIGRQAGDALSLSGLGATLAVSAGVALRVAVRKETFRSPWVQGAFLGAFALAALLVALALGLWGATGRSLVPAIIAPVATLAFVRPRGGRWRTLKAFGDSVFAHPARVLVVTFLGLSALGALLMRLPGVGRDQVIAPIDAAFTATSAVCVTGLIVLDTPEAFSGFGQVLILLLIQVGGLGIMSFSTVAIAAFGRRLSLKHEGVVAGLLSGNRDDIFTTLRRLLLMTFGFELLGAGLLLVAFLRTGDALGQAAWRAVFTSVSAFCNAGFALQTDSLIPYQTNPLVLHVVAVLIIAGGLSPMVIADVPNFLRRRPVALQTKVILLMTAVLLALGTALLAGLEWTGAFAHLDRVDRLQAAWFQSVTLRTAGFNSVDFSALAPATVWLMCAFMIIGGSPGGTAGGVKTTTAYVLLSAVLGAIRGRWEATGFRRRISDRTVYKATSIVTIALVFVVFGVVAVQVTQPLALQETLFEVVSALGTVGLSVGATGKLDDVGKVIVMICMFVGRVGPLTLFLFLRERHTQTLWEMPVEEVDVG